MLIDSKYVINNLSYEQAQAIVRATNGIALIRAYRGGELTLHASGLSPPAKLYVSNDEIIYDKMHFSSFELVLAHIQPEFLQRYKFLLNTFDYIKATFLFLREAYLNDSNINATLLLQCNAENLNKSKLTQLHLNGSNIVTVMSDALAMSLPENQTLRELDIYTLMNDAFTVDKADRLIQSIFSSKYLQKVSFIVDSLSYNQWSIITNNLPNCIALKELNIGSSDIAGNFDFIPANVMPDLFAAFARLPSLKDLSIIGGNSGVRTEHQGLIQELLANSKTLEILAIDMKGSLDVNQMLTVPEVLNNTKLHNFCLNDNTQWHPLLQYNFEKKSKPGLKGLLIRFFTSSANRRQVRNKAGNPLTDDEIKSVLPKEVADAIFMPLPKPPI